MEEGRQKSKRLSYTAKFKREVIWCAEEMGNHKAAAIFGVDESNVRLWRKHKKQSAGVRRHEGNSLDTIKVNFLKLMIQSSQFFKINYCIALLLWHVQRLYHFYKIQLSTANLIRTQL
jgi:hypothetical protein